MGKSEFTDEQIALALKQVEAGLPIKELCRKYGISATTFCSWRSKYKGLEASEMRELRSLRHENRHLKQLIAELLRVGS